MKIKIISTTDGHFVGQEAKWLKTHVVLSNGIKIPVDRVIDIPEGFRFVNSNYIIDAKKA